MRKIFYRTRNRETLDAINGVNNIIGHAQMVGCGIGQDGAREIFKAANRLPCGRDRNQVMSMTLRIIEAEGHDIDKIKELAGA